MLNHFWLFQTYIVAKNTNTNKVKNIYLDIQTINEIFKDN
jgi:hypothetical protein